MGKNVAALVKLLAVRRRTGNTWSSEEAGTFLEATDYLYPAYALLLVLGLRKDEVLGVTAHQGKCSG